MGWFDYAVASIPLRGAVQKQAPADANERIDMKWSIAAPFFVADGAPDRNRWIDDFISSRYHSFEKIPPPSVGSNTNWHGRNSRGTPVGGWRQYWRHAAAALRGADGIITLFPQLAAMAGMQNRISRKAVPHIAWCFNVGHLPGGLLRTAARAALSHIDRFVVHSSGEVEIIRSWLDLPEGRVKFVHLQRAAIPIIAEEEREKPFLVSIGSANRDIELFLRPRG